MAVRRFLDAWSSNVARDLWNSLLQFVHAASAVLRLEQRCTNEVRSFAIFSQRIPSCCVPGYGYGQLIPMLSQLAKSFEAWFMQSQRRYSTRTLSSLLLNLDS
jgi:hypothetical protein